MATARPMPRLLPQPPKPRRCRSRPCRRQSQRLKTCSGLPPRRPRPPSPPVRPSQRLHWPCAQATRRSTAPRRRLSARSPGLRGAGVTEEPTVSPDPGPVPASSLPTGDLLEVPTATSVRSVPAKLLIDNRVVINNHLACSRGGKVLHPHHRLRAGPCSGRDARTQQQLCRRRWKPALSVPAHINLAGIAIDLALPTAPGSCSSRRSRQPRPWTGRFWAAYGRSSKGRSGHPHRRGLPGHDDQPDQPRHHRHGPLRAPADARARARSSASAPSNTRRSGRREPTILNRNGVSKILTPTSTHDHRIIPGRTVPILRVIHGLPLGEDGLRRHLREPAHPLRAGPMGPRHRCSHDDDINKVARVQQLINAYRVRGHLMGRHRPLEYRQRRHPDLDVTTHDLAVGSGPPLADRRLRWTVHLPCAASSASCATPIAAPSASSTCTSRIPSSGKWIQRKVEVPTPRSPRGASCGSCAAQRRRSLRDLPPDQVRGPEALPRSRAGSPSSPCSTGPLRRRATVWTRSASVPAPRPPSTSSPTSPGKSPGQIFQEFEASRTRSPSRALGT